MPTFMPFIPHDIFAPQTYLTSQTEAQPNRWRRHSLFIDPTTMRHPLVAFLSLDIIYFHHTRSVTDFTGHPVSRFPEVANLVFIGGTGISTYVCRKESNLTLKSSVIWFLFFPLILLTVFIFVYFLYLVYIGYAFIYMDDERDGEDAIRALDRKEFGRKGRRLRVEWTKVIQQYDY